MSIPGPKAEARIEAFAFAAARSYKGDTNENAISASPNNYAQTVLL